MLFLIFGYFLFFPLFLWLQIIFLHTLCNATLRFSNWYLTKGRKRFVAKYSQFLFRRIRNELTWNSQWVNEDGPDLTTWSWLFWLRFDVVLIAGLSCSHYASGRLLGTRRSTPKIIVKIRVTYWLSKQSWHIVYRKLL